MANYITDILVPAQSLSFKASSDGYCSAEVSVDGYYFPSGTGNKRIGEVVFDGESFIGHWEYESSAGVTYHFGNLSLKGSGEDSGEPFLLSYNYNAKKVTVITNSTEATHTVACYLFADLSYISVQHTTGYIHAGIDVNDLTGLTVTATFTDSTKRTVTGYTIEGDSSGKTLEGKNVIIVKWEGEATRITLIGVLDNAVSISATYTGGVVDAWISVNELTGVTVYAHLDDGTSVPVTGYTLSGKLVAGVNVVTVTYGELTTTFEVTAYASIVLKNRDGEDTRYKDVIGIKLKQSDGSTKVFVNPDGDCHVVYTFNDTGEITKAMLFGFTTIPTGYFAYMNQLTEVDLSGSPGIISIGDYAFYNCTALTSVTIPDGVTSIGNYAFYGCSALTSIDIPEGVTSIGNYAFASCKSLTSITIPDSVTSIGSTAFASCSALTSITIPDGVTSIGNNTFQNCTSLTSITIPDSVTSIGIAAFNNCKSLTSITIPDGVTSIGNNAFQTCTSLKSITIPDGVTSIGNSTFYSCTSLTSITIPGSVTSIGNSAFVLCSALTSITIPDGVTSIGNEAFSSCSALTSITIPGSVTKIGNYAFNNCPALTSVTFKDTTTWYRTTSSSYTGGNTVSSSYVGNASTMATYLKSTYLSYYWYKK